MHIGKYIDLVHRTEKDLVDAFKVVAKAHRDEVDIEQTCLLLSSWSQQLAQIMEPVANRYNKENDKEPDRLTKTLLKKARKGSMAMLRDLHDLYLIVNEVLVCCTILKQGGTALADEELVAVCEEIEQQTTRQSSWLMTRMKSAAPQTLIVAKP
ncbi:molybdopterin oxidoreductase [Ginsengibacter hankyongi]|uniref:Molybdopterin oxidoreductase n=1 Tax=Ginsengibacter hankyongi TaxID=2607284 RepID=A0A5J5IHK7_9BACT|nr:molybdopterin oxidoreductase [Ginsengibacter hankyongi]KAA9038756.1 molybdopterin oxidoreductase [Ginsengibacter hankyongi]